MTSKCAKSDSAEYIQKAVETGFAGMVFTNHFFRGNTAIDRDIPWKDFVEYYKKDWYNAKVEGDKADIDVIFGLEEGYGKGKECLIYGLTPELIAGCADFSKLPIKELSAFVRENGGMIFCAHPFRQRGYITDPSDEPDMTLFDGIEVYNRGNTDEDNLTAEIFAKKHNLLTIAGGDIHSTGGFGFSGISLPERVHDGKELVAALRKADFTLVKDNPTEK